MSCGKIRRPFSQFCARVGRKTKPHVILVLVLMIIISAKSMRKSPKTPDSSRITLPSPTLAKYQVSTLPETDLQTCVCETWRALRKNGILITQTFSKGVARFFARVYLKRMSVICGFISHSIEDTETWTFSKIYQGFEAIIVGFILLTQEKSSSSKSAQPPPSYWGILFALP